MKGHPSKLIPVSIALTVVGLACLAQFIPRLWPSVNPFQRMEWMTYDWRVRQAADIANPVAPQLGAVFIDDQSLQLVNQGLSYSWPWPRQLHGRLLSKLHEQGAEAVAFDILFHERHSPDPSTDVRLSNGLVIASDNYLAVQLERSRKGVLAVFGETLGDHWHAILPDPLFRTNALAIGLAVSELDPDGVLRRLRPFRDDPVQGRIWHMGIVMAARSLGLDLDTARISDRRIVLPGPDGLERVIPLDAQGRLLIHWQLRWNDPRLTKGSFEEAAALVNPRDPDSQPDWSGKLVFVGSIGSGNNISDVGTTPLAQETYLVSKHWNVANSVLRGEFVRQLHGGWDYLLIILLGFCGTVLTLKLRAPWPSLLIGISVLAYVIFTWAIFMATRLWVPMILPVLGGLIGPHVCLVTYQVLFEQKEKRHIQQVFSKLVSPDVVQELLGAETLNLGGVRRRITVLFSDVRGFTEMTNASQEQAEAHVRKLGLGGSDAERFYDQQAALVLSTVNEYLGTIAQQVKKHKGTLDKYIGDCVMAFWGAPTRDEHHAASCVRAAIDAQRAIYRLNQARARQNKTREAANQQRTAAGQFPLPLLPLLSLGTGINTGVSIVGLMGSEDHILNYTVFGPDVNLASRLESVSGRSRIIIGQSTYEDLAKLDPDLAQICVALPEVMVKGIRHPVKIYEVPWKESTGTTALA